MPRPQEPPLLNTLNLVLLTDNATDRTLYSRWIQHAAPTPIHLQGRASGKLSLEECQASPPDCILLDDRLSDMSGLDFLTTIQQTRSGCRIPIIFLTRQENYLLASQAMKLGAQDYLVKTTLSSELLWHTIKHAIERYATTQRLQALQQQHNLILQSSGDGLVVVGTDGLIRFANIAAEQLFQQSSQDLLNAPFPFPVLQGQTTEIDIVGKAEHTTPVEMRVMPIEWEGESAYVASLRDLTERRKTEEDRRRLEIERQYSQKLESLGVLAGGIAHDFNNLLMTIVARSGLALRSLPTDAPAKEHLCFIEKAGLRGGELANQMLAFSGQTKLDFQAVQLSKLIQDMSSFLRSTVSKRLRLEYDLATSLPLVRADLAQIRQMLMNLVTNASEAIGEEEGLITLSTSQLNPADHDFRNWYILGDLLPGPSSSIRIQDTGCGMKSETIPKIFDPFFTTKFPGRGLGLAALLGISRAHAATIAVKSQVGIGTEFWLIFPTSPVKPVSKKAPTLSFPNEQSSSHKKPVVLIVDDEEDVRVACSLILQEIGYETLVAMDGEVGLQIFQQHQKDIKAVLLDLTMPNMDGYQLFEKIRDVNLTVPVILSSGYSEEEAMKRYKESGIATFIQKPYQVEVLIKKFEAFIPLPDESHTIHV